MPCFEFNDGTKHILQSHPALPAARTRELAAEFNSAQRDVCRRLAALGYPLERVTQELRAGHLAFFREGSDRDSRRADGRKAAYRFAGFTPGHLEEYARCAAERDSGVRPAGDFAGWEAEFLMRFTFDVIEQVALRASPPAGAPAARAELASALAAARARRDEILGGNLLLAAKIVIRRARCYSGLVLDDLFAAALDGLMIAIGRYDPSVGQFSTYATPWIKMAIDRYAAKTRHVIRIPIGMQDRVRRERSGTGEGEPPVRAISIPEVQSLEEPVRSCEDGDLRLEDVLADVASSRPREAVEQADIARILHEGLGGLDELRQFVIALRHDIGDAGGLAARFFREEAALSLARGRASAAAALGLLEEPARIRIIGTPEPVAAGLRAVEETDQLAEPLAIDAGDLACAV